MASEILHDNKILSLLFKITQGKEKTEKNNRVAPKKFD